MCGIFGAIATDGELSLDGCLRAAAAIAHRGPDGLGVLTGRLTTGEVTFALNPDLERLRATRGEIMIAHRRLSIIDLAPAAFQPMTGEDGKTWVIFNGEIYNHRELRQTLIAKGHRFRTDHSDTEVLVHGYEEWGPALVQRLRGMFALVVLDLAKRELFVARDPFGEKPLYLATTPRGIAFASELKALLELPDTRREIDREALSDYLRLGYVPAPRAIYRGITKLRAAHQALIPLDRPPRVEPTPYWQPARRATSPKSAAAFREELDATIAEAVALRLESDVPLGAYLSGGLDSTTVVRALAKARAAPLDTFTIAFKEAAFDESKFAEQVSARYGTRHHTETTTAASLLALMPKLSTIFDEPFADSSALPTLALAEMARARVTVALSGDGGDELMAGYARYAWNAQLARAFDHRLGAAAAFALRPLVRAWPESLRGRGLVRLLHDDPARRYEDLMSDRWLLERARLPVAPSPIAALWPPNGALIDQMRRVDIELYIPEDLATKVDRTAMSVGLEVRAPLLDRPLFELIARTPTSYFFDGKHGKLPMRQALAAELGDAFVDRPKQGFGVPLGKWFRNELRPVVDELVASPSPLVGALFARETLAGLVQQHVHGSRDQSHRIWSLLMLDRWHRQYGGTL